MLQLNETQNEKVADFVVPIKKGMKGATIMFIVVAAVILLLGIFYGHYGLFGFLLIVTVVVFVGAVFFMRTPIRIRCDKKANQYIIDLPHFASVGAEKQHLVVQEKLRKILFLKPHPLMISDRRYITLQFEKTQVPIGPRKLLTGGSSTRDAAFFRNTLTLDEAKNLASFFGAPLEIEK